MKVLHTSDWHLGRSLYGQKRYDEQERFLRWLEDLIKSKQVDVLLVAGDIFDTSTPSNRAQSMYYKFLSRIAFSECRKVIITGGNHDSPSFLNAPQEVLKALNIDVRGSMSENPEDEVISITDEDGELKLIVCAVPYLRDRDIRISEAGETEYDKLQKLKEAMQLHYNLAAEAGERIRQDKSDVPMIGMGHLFVSGSSIIEDDGVRKLRVGTLSEVKPEIFPETFDYVALGHLHSCQKAAGKKKLRYCGAPLAMGFGEASTQKKVIIIEFEGKKPIIREIDVPVFQELVKICGDMTKIEKRITELKKANSSAWLEIEYTGIELAAGLRNQIDELTADTELKVLRVKNQRIMDRVIKRSELQETLDDLNEEQVFERCLQSHEIPKEQWPVLLSSYREILKSMEEADLNEE